MIHIFFLTLAVMAGVYSFPFIVFGVGLILASRWFWTSVFTLIAVTVSLAIFGPAALPALAFAYVGWRLVTWERSKTRERIEAQQMRAAVEADQRRRAEPTMKWANVVSCRDPQTVEPSREASPQRRNWYMERKLSAASSVRELLR
jgi:hypothetical protein